MATMGEESSPSVTAPTDTTGSASSPQSDAVTNDLQDLSLQPALNLLLIHQRKNGELIAVQKWFHAINTSETESSIILTAAFVNTAFISINYVITNTIDVPLFYELQ